VDDLIEGIVRFMDSTAEITGPINLGNPCEFTMLELAEKIKIITRSSSKLILKPLPNDDPKQRKPDIGLAEKTLRWNPQVQLNEGLLKTVQYFEDYLRRF
jgi:UDP-glucuronate decarboxylase